MPGFIMGGFGKGVDPNTDSKFKPFYTYTWAIESVLGSYANNGHDMALVLCRDITMPTFSVKSERVLGSSLNYKYASEVEWEDIQITWYDTIGLAPIIRRWRSQIWTPNLGLGVAGDYKYNTTVRSYTYDWNIDTSKVWTLYGSWPSSIKEGDLTYTDSDIKVISVTLSYDYAEDSIANTTPSFSSPNFDSDSAFPEYESGLR